MYDQKAEGSWLCVCVDLLEVFWSAPLLKTDHTVENGAFVLLQAAVGSPLCIYTLCTVEHQTYHSPSTWQRWHQAVYIVSGFRLISMETPGGRDFIPILQISNVAFKDGNRINAVLSRPASMLTHVGCVLTLKGDSVKVRSLWFLGTKISRLGKVPHHYLGPPTTFHTSQVSAGFWNVYL